MAGTQNSLAIAEKLTDHKWDFIFRKKEAYKLNPAERVNYNFNMKLDDDIVTSQKNLATAETVLESQYGEDYVNNVVPEVVPENTTAAAEPVAAPAVQDSE